MKIIIAGCGYIARTHIGALNKLGHEVTWVVGRDQARTADFALEFGIKNHTTDLKEALSGDAEVVHICTPPTRHVEMIRQILAAGKHIVCEKPLCLDPDEAEELASLAERSGLTAALCCNVRYYPACIEMARRISDGQNGRTMIIAGSYLQEFHVPPHPDGWRFDPVRSGDQRAVSEIGTHWFDLAYALTGTKIKSLSALLGNWHPVRYRIDGMLTEGPEGEPVEVSTEDAASVIMEFEGGAIGTLMLSEVSRGHINDLSIEITGSKGTVRWEEAEPSVLKVAEGGSFETLEFGSIEREDTFVNLFRDVYASIDGRDHGRFPDFRDGVYIARVCDAVKKSGQAKSPVICRT